uniref:Uncharacterized protein n=1 Tax=Anopheles culicifacies TaxID=139723 RepID=A0A182MBZ6_9DIPT
MVEGGTLIGFTFTFAAVSYRVFGNLYQEHNQMFGSNIYAITTSINISRRMATDAPVPANEYSVAFVTVPDNKVAVNVARQLVEKSLVACVNIIPGLTSIYAWEGKINEDPEVLMMIKTRTSRVEELIRFVREIHPYSVAEYNKTLNEANK